MILYGQRPYPPLRQITTWEGRVTFRCDVCGCGVNADHVVGGDECKMLTLERTRKHGEP